MEEKREHPRYSACDKKYVVKLDMGEQEVLDVDIKDIGLGGIGLHLTAKEKISGSNFHNRQVLLRFFERDESTNELRELLDISGRIRWSQYSEKTDSSAIGVHFGHLDGERKEILKKIIVSCLEHV